MSGIGLVSTFLTAGDLTDQPQGLEAVVASLSRIPVERALDWAASMLAPSAFGATWREHQAQQASTWFDAATEQGRRARDLVLSGERLLLAPQVLLLMARLALLYGARRPAGDHEGDDVVAAGINDLRRAMLVLAHHVGAERRAAESATHPNEQETLGGLEVTTLETHLAANQLLNRLPFPASVFDRFERRWRELPREQAGEPDAVDLFADFEEATGVSLNDLGMVAVALWARTIGDHGPRVPPGHLDALGLAPDAIAKAVGLLSDTVEGLASRSAQANPDADPQFDMTLFGQTPVVRLANGGLLVISPVLLLERAFGWLPFFDIKEAFTKQGPPGKKRAARSETYLRRTTAEHAVDTLRHATEAGSRPGRLYDEAQVQAAFGTSAPNADAACAWPGAWVVAEVSSRQVTRKTAAAASAQDLLEDLDKGVVQKAEQLDGTIKALRAHPTRLTREATDEGGQRFWPMLIVTEGFPVNPLTVQRVRRMVRDAGLLCGDDVAALVIVDTEALEAVETVAEGGGASLPELLAQHAASELQDYGFREWLLLHHRGLRPPARVINRWDRAFEPVLDALSSQDTGRTTMTYGGGSDDSPAVTT